MPAPGGRLHVRRHALCPTLLFDIPLSRLHSSSLCDRRYGTTAFAEWESANIGVNSNTWNVSNTYSVTLQDCLGMMVLDAVWLGLLAW